MKKTRNLVITQRPPRALRLCVRIFEDKLDVYGGHNE
jgi:hypothetical protein